MRLLWASVSLSVKCSRCLCLLPLLWCVRGGNPQSAWTLGRCGVVSGAGRWGFSSAEALGPVCGFQTDPELETGCSWVFWTLRCAEPHFYKKPEEGESFGAWNLFWRFQDLRKEWTYPFRGESPTASDQDLLCLMKSRVFSHLPHLLLSVAVMLGARQRRQRSLFLFLFFTLFFALVGDCHTLILLWLQTLTLFFKKNIKKSHWLI